MNLIRSLDDLKHISRNPNQYWFYVILANAGDPTEAARSILANLDMFDLDTGRDCDYYLPGFICDMHGLAPVENMQFLAPPDMPKVYLERLGEVPFSARDFVRFYRELEEQGDRRWRYSGRCELLVFNIDPGSSRVDFSDFYAYDLDDIVVNRRSISEFIRRMIMISQDHPRKEDAKRQIDEIYYDMVMPAPGNIDNSYMASCVREFERSGFPGRNYCFISYCTRDFRFVRQVRDLLEAGGIKCWMAPFDIPRGTSYPYIIENAILNASTFILMLSRQAVHSVWVEKELLRAIAAFQQSAPERICIAWCGGEFPLKGTAFALPLENIQIKVDLENDPENWRLLEQQPGMEGILAGGGTGTDAEEASPAGDGPAGGVAEDDLGGGGPAPGAPFRGGRIGAGAGDAGIPLRGIPLFRRSYVRRLLGAARQEELDYWDFQGRSLVRYLQDAQGRLQELSEICRSPEAEYLSRQLAEETRRLQRIMHDPEPDYIRLAEAMTEEIERTMHLLRRYRGFLIRLERGEAP